jgi:hypothetical protein
MITLGELEDLLYDLVQDEGQRARIITKLAAHFENMAQRIERIERKLEILP